MFDRGGGRVKCRNFARSEPAGEGVGIHLEVLEPVNVAPLQCDSARPVIVFCGEGFRAPLDGRLQGIANCRAFTGPPFQAQGVVEVQRGAVVRAT